MAPREAGANYAAVCALSSTAAPVAGRRIATRIRGISHVGTGVFLSNADAMAPEGTTILRTLQAYRTAGAAGRTREAEEMLTRLMQLAPAHPAVLNEFGLRVMQQGDAARARELFQRATSADPSHPALWSNLASSLHTLGLADEEMQAIERALALEPRHPTALLQKGALIEQRGDRRTAARVYRAALATVGPEISPPPALHAALKHARAAVETDDAAFAALIEERVSAVRAQHGTEAARRADRCLEILTGRRARYLPQPTFLYFPGIPALEFFDNAQFPWLAAIEAASVEMRAELSAVIASDQSGLQPYVAYPEGVPLDQWRELNQSRRWSAYFLWNQGAPEEAHIARCPRTAQLLRNAPQCDVPQRGPNAFFSILEPHTRIPPHTGVTNARLTVHVPLIVPPQCGFRVGGETREWVVGRAWAFDDSIEHEAWNDSELPRAILIFDIWNPFLSAAERAVVRAAMEAVVSYYGGVPEGL